MSLSLSTSESFFSAHELEDVADEDDDGIAAHVWEKGYSKSWESVFERDGKLVRANVLADSRESNSIRSLTQAQAKIIRRGMIRFVCLVYDCSESAYAMDIRPSRAQFLKRTLLSFVDSFFDQNPLSQICLIRMRDGAAERVSELSGSIRRHLDVLASDFDECSGPMSLQNGLEEASEVLSSVPPYGSREVIFWFASMTTCDPGDVFTSIRSAKSRGIRCSAVSLVPEVFIVRELVHSTQGDYVIGLSEDHIQESSKSFLEPPPTMKDQNLPPTLIRMGFPRRKNEVNATYEVLSRELKRGGFFCPQCGFKYASLPVKCEICHLQLVSSPQLARTYHHLFPVPPFTPLESSAALDSSKICSGCGDILQTNSNHSSDVFVCSSCCHEFCSDCSIFIHESLRNCPGCELSSSKNDSVGLTH